MTPEQTLEWLAQQHFDQCCEERPIQDWIRKMKSQLPEQPAVTESHKQEPVAFLTNRRQRLNVEFNATGLTLMPKSVDWKMPLYTTPPTQQSCSQRPSRSDMTWVGLTDEDYQILRNGVVKQGKPLHWMIEHIESKLKEKNI